MRNQCHLEISPIFNSLGSEISVLLGFDFVWRKGAEVAAVAALSGLDAHERCLCGAGQWCDHLHGPGTQPGEAATGHDWHEMKSGCAKLGGPPF